MRSVLAIVILGALYLLSLFLIGWPRITDALARVRDSNTAAQVLGLVFLGLALRACRWQYYVRKLGWRVPAGPSLMAFLASFALTVTPGKAGEVVKSVMLRARYAVPVSQSAAALIIERLTDLVAMVILALGGLAVFSNMTSYAVVSAGVLGIAFLVFSQPRAYGRLVELATRLRRLQPYASRVQHLFDTTQTLLKPRPLAVGFVLALVAWSAEAMALKLVTQAIEPSLEFSFWLAGSLFALATLVAALAMLPGGVGGFEAVLIVMLTQLGATARNAAAVAVVFRLCTVWLVSVIGLIFLLLWAYRMVPAAIAGESTQR